MAKATGFKINKMLKKFLSANFLMIVILLIASVLRLYKLSVNPPSLFGDELDLGYQSYSILMTGKDYQGNFMPIQFHSIAEWRTPLYTYTAVPTIAIFGITPIGVRLPAAVFGILTVLIIYLFINELLSYGKNEDSKKYALVAAALMAVSPWSLQFSRAGFEVTQMLFLLLMGLWLFFRALKDSKLLWLSVSFLVLTLWGYPTTKLFVPFLVMIAFVLFRKEILKMPKKSLWTGVVAGFVIGTPIILSTLFGSGSQRISDISVIKDPLMEQVVGKSRELDLLSGTPLIVSKALNNKYMYFTGEFVNNYFRSFSTDFLFLKGDINLRQSAGTGLLYMIESVALLAGLAFFLLEKNRDLKIKLLTGFWLIFGAVPSALTLGGGAHATRMALMLPVLVFLTSYGWVSLYKSVLQKYKSIFKFSVLTAYIISMVFYLHQYFTFYPFLSEKWWHNGWTDAIHTVKSVDKDYERVIISMNGEPAWIFFAANYEYPPDKWQKEFPIGRDEEISGFGKISHIDKYYFGTPDGGVQIYGLGKYINGKTLYLANAKEHGDNLILNPEKTPPGLKLIKAIPLLSGEPAFYLFAGTAK
jgi:4-amino-4-deoxy-L-arabinose transferase-like glycosyltransferase